MSLDPRLSEGIELFNQEQFFEAHEVWEDLWREARSESSEKADFFRGLIQMAGAYHHLRKKNFKGAEALFETSLHYLKSSRLDVPINLKKLISDFELSFCKETQFAKIELK